MTTLKLGCIAKDKITGFRGVVIAHSRCLTNIDRWTVQPRVIKDGKAVPSRSFDEGSLDFVEDTPIRVTPVDHGDEPFEVGDTVRAHVTGVEGVVTAITEWSEGCITLTVQPRELHDGSPVDVIGVDVRSADVVTRARPRAEPVKAKTGGPHREPPRAR